MRFEELTKDFKPEWIRELNEVGKQLENVTVKLPSRDDLERAKVIIENILPPQHGEVTMGYVRNVLLGLEYAETHSRCTLLDDIKAGRQWKISDYK